MSKEFQNKNINKTGVVSIIGATWSIWWRYISQFRWEWKYFGKILLVTLVVIVGFPFRLWEKFRVGKQIQNTKIDESPVFILGHWRGGTTLLHNLLSKDPQFGYVTYLQGLFPHAFLASNFFRWFATRIMPSKRPMDNMEIDTESPQEEELALIAQSGHSLYNMWIAPEKQNEIWNDYALFKNKEIKNKWSKGYLDLLKTATLNFQGKRLVLKNPPNTMRIPYLLEQFPNAKFIFIYRNPYKVYASTYKLYRDVINFFQLHDEDESFIDQNILRIYKEMNEAYQKNKNLIPQENLIEIKFEDFVKNKEEGLKNIYQKLDLGDFKNVESIYQKYLLTIQNHKKNKLNTDKEVLKKVNDNWSFAFKEFNYEMEKIEQS